jgi:hypothetical protein
MEAGHDALDVVVVERIEVSLNQLLFRVIPTAFAMSRVLVASTPRRESNLVAARTIASRLLSGFGREFVRLVNGH